MDSHWQRCSSSSPTPTRNDEPSFRETLLLGFSVNKGQKSKDRCLSSPKPPPEATVPANRARICPLAAPRPVLSAPPRPAKAAQTDTAPTKRSADRRRARGALRASDGRLE